MKPLWNAPSLGTFRANEARVVIFLVVVFQPLVLVPLVMLAPLRASLVSAWRKKPQRVWRCAVTVSAILALLLTLPISPLYVGAGWPFAEGRLEPENAMASLIALCVPYINAALTMELALLPIVAASAVHSVWFSKAQPGPTADK